MLMKGLCNVTRSWNNGDYGSQLVYKVTSREKGTREWTESKRTKWVKSFVKRVTFPRIILII